jgi:hypothetical protein
MKDQLEKEYVVGNRFDELAKTVAGGLTRRKTLQLIGGSITGVLVSLNAWGAPGNGKGCGQICAPLFNPHDQGAFSACTEACEDCKSCNGTPSLTSTQALVCAGATPCRSAGGGLACCQAGANCCGAGICCETDCCAGTCLPACPAGTVRDPVNCTCVSVLSRVFCICQDRAQIDFCTPIDCLSQDRSCSLACAAHGGPLGRGRCIPGDPTCLGPG